MMEDRVEQDDGETVRAVRPEAVTRFDLSGKAAMVTGASRGIGRALAIGLAQHGANVFGVARNADDLAQTSRLIVDSGGSADWLASDLCANGVAEEAVAAMLASFGKIDIVVNNAGLDDDKPIGEISLDDWRRVFALNLDAYFMI